VVKPLGMAEMNRILEIVDSLGISREAVRIPLAPSGAGSVEKLAPGLARIVAPADRPLEEWLPALRDALRELDLPRSG